MTNSDALVARIRELSHSYKRSVALDSISIDIPAGRMIGLLGPDGVGKSTLLGLLAGSRKLQKGTLEVLGGDMRSSRHRRNVGPRIAYMPQGLGKNLYVNLSVNENLEFFGKLFGHNQTELKARIELLTKATGLQEFLNRPAGNLSGGMKQKLGLCCSLIHSPDFLILDEPTTGVDPLSRQQFWELIDSIRASQPNMSVLVSTAYMDEAERFDWLFAMDEGKILAEGSPDDLKQKTAAPDLETAYIGLLPEEKQGGRRVLQIPPLADSDSAPAIIATSLTRRFGDFTAVDQVSFEIRQGEIFGFLGSNGSGKTTTMKMLTGLLAPSDGHASLFGRSIDANDIETRKRVGFMSQAFSLYGELTVAQNFSLHARLYHLDAEKARLRIKSLSTRFGLDDYRDALSSSLPLGMRQRLSLAVAIIHEPDMLILDEPTSGVDPVARDEFWALLVEQSREYGVTIFISTHFMNEALRCDRISLMHAGTVLVYDTPDNIIQSKHADNLEEAFIAYIQDAIGETAGTDSTETSTLAFAPAATDRDKARSLSGFSLTRLLAFSYREAMEVIRDPVRVAFAFFGSALLLIIIAYGNSQDVNDLTYAALDFDQSPESQEYLSNFSSSSYFIEHSPIYSIDELETRLVSNEISLAIEIPDGFGRDLKQGNSPEISAWIDGANTSRAATIEGYVSGGHSAFLATRSRKAGRDPEAGQRATIEPRYLYNPSFESIYMMGPSVPPMLLLLFPAILMAVSVAREKEIGTITNFYVTPTNRFEFLIGKQLPYIAIAMINYVVLTLMVVFLLQVPLKGSLLALSIGALFYSAASTGYGLLISTLTKSQVAAVFAAAVLSMMPTMMFSGMIQPVSTLEGGARVMGNLWPTTYFMRVSVGAFTKSLGFSDLSRDLLILALFAPVFVLLASLFLRDQEK